MAQSSSEVCWVLDGSLPVLYGDSRPRVSEAEGLTAEQAMETAGVVLFRDFDISVDEFRATTHRLGGSHTTEKWAPGAMAGRGPSIGLHTEHAFLPAVPASIWFYCTQPAERGGATVICDGAAVAADLSAGARQFLEQTDVLYWSRYSRKATRSRRYAQFLADPPGLGRRFRDSEEVQHDDHYETTTLCSPLIQSRIDHRPVFGNHILNAVSHPGQDQPPRLDGFHQVRLPTKEPLPQDLIDELKAVTSELSLKVQLKRNDMLWIDNTRFLHGRGAYQGSRQVLALIAYHGDQWKPGFGPADYPSRTVPPPPAAR